MRKLLLASGLLLAAGSASAQTNNIKVNILSPIVKTGSFFFEHKLNPNSSIQLGALFTNWSINDTKITGFAITPEYRFYLSESKEAMQGFYVAPFLRYQNLTLKDTHDSYVYTGSGSGTYQSQTDEASLDTFGGGVLIGHQWIFKQRFSLDTFLGPSYNGGSVTYKSNGSNTGTLDAGTFKGFGIRTGITFGIAF
ncbi:hypothetical protein GCM10028824_32040 [Hymenobacter segetis]|uniref:DUF3575 domain-containing protein n=1 Tax=Hymenobacter segetis TaxID=2025509 RepID=A0ABU9LPH7_9BACT